MLELVKRPPITVLSKSPAWFAVKLTDDSSKRIKATVQDGHGGPEVGSVYSFASVNDTAYFELSEFFDHAVTSEFKIHPIGQGIAQEINSHTKKEFNILFDNGTHALAQMITVIKGEITPDLFSIAGYGTSFNTVEEYMASKYLLSLRPTSIFVRHPMQPERLYFYAVISTTVDISLSAYTPKGAVHVNAGSFSASARSLWEIDTSYQSLVKPNIPAGASAAHYRVRLYSGMVNLTPIYKYFVDFNVPSDGSFVFQNSLGGFDTLCPAGETSVRSSRSHNASRLVTVPGSQLPAQRISGKVNERVITRNTGMLSSDYADYLPQILFSNNAYWVPHEGDPHKITFDAGNISLSKSPGDLVFADIPYFFNPAFSAEELQ